MIFDVDLIFLLVWFGWAAWELNELSERWLILGLVENERVIRCRVYVNNVTAVILAWRWIWRADQKQPISLLRWVQVVRLFVIHKIHDPIQLSNIYRFNNYRLQIEIHKNPQNRTVFNIT